MKNKAANNKSETYQAPQITTKTLSIGFFLNNRSHDSIDHLLGIDVMASTSGCSGGSCCSKTDVCFLPGTTITCADKSEKLIEDIAVGELVLSYDLVSNSYSISPVIHVESHIRIDGYYILNSSIRVTNDHPVRTTTGWKLVENLTESDTLIGLYGNVPIESIDRKFEETLVYNIQVDSLYKNYFANNILAFSYSFAEKKAFNILESIRLKYYQ